MSNPAAAAKVTAADPPSKVLRLSRRSDVCRCAKKSSSFLGARRRMSSQTASGAQGERQMTLPLHDNLGSLHYKLTGDAVAGLSLTACSTSARTSSALTTNVHWVC